MSNHAHWETRSNCKQGRENQNNENKPTLNITQFAPSREGVTSHHKEEEVREMRRWLRDDERGW